MHHLQLRRMCRRKCARRRPDTEHHARARHLLPLPREIVDVDSVGRVMVEFERVIPDEKGACHPLRHGILRCECPRFVLRRGIVRTAQDDLEEGVRGRRLVREQHAPRTNVLCGYARNEQNAAHIAVRGDAHIRQDQQIVRMARIRDRGDPRYVQIPRLEPPVQLRRRRTQDVQPLCRPMRERIRERQHIQECNMTQTRYHAHPPSLSLLLL